MKKMRHTVVAGLAALLCMVGMAQASVTVLDFEGVNATYPSDFAQVLDFYNGGTSSAGTSGTNYGVGFTPEALAMCLNTPETLCSNTSRGGVGNPDSDRGALFFLSGSQIVMNVPAGFDTGFSFFYTALYYASSVSVYDRLDGAGNLLATVNLPTTSSTCDAISRADFCPFVAVGVSFSGTAHAVVFAGVAEQVVFDDITFGRAIPGGEPVPEPTTLALMGTGLAGLVFAARRRGRFGIRIHNGLYPSC